MNSFKAEEQTNHLEKSKRDPEKAPKRLDL